MQPLVIIIVLNWNGHADTIRCVASLERQTYPNRQILVIDNGSTDGSLVALRALGDRIILVENPTNDGFTGGNNRAMARAFADGAAYVWLFNNDATVDEDALACMVARCEADPRVGMISPLVREEDDPEKIQFAGGIFDLAVPVYTPCYDIATGRDWQERMPERMVLHGTALLIRRSLYEAVGGLDDDFFAYWEDIEYSVRSARAGFHNVTAFETSICHGSKATGSAPETVKPHYYYYVTRNELLMWHKLTPGRRYLKALVWILARSLEQAARMPGYRAGIDAVMAGLWDGWRGVSGRHDPTRRMPQPLRWLLGQHPRVVLKVLGRS